MVKQCARIGFAAGIALALVSGIDARGVTVPFTEQFASGPANWFDPPGAAPLPWNGSGGPDGSSHVFTPFSFAALGPGATPALFRAQDEFGSSGGAFEGDWLAAGVTQFSGLVRHNAPNPLTFFTRVAGPGNFPGVAAIHFASVPSGVWTPISFGVTAGNPQFVFEGPMSNFANVFGNVGHVQVGVIVPAELAGGGIPWQFDLDQASIVPEPGALGLLLGGTVVPFVFRRRRVTCA